MMLLINLHLKTNHLSLKEPMNAEYGACFLGLRTT